PDLRASPGALAIARDVVRVAGPEAVAYLQGQVSQDVEHLATGATAWSFVLQPTGKVAAWVRLTRTADDEVVVDVDGGHGDAVLARLRRFLLRTKADVDRLAWRAVAVRGPGAVALADAAGDPGAELAVPAAWPGVEGVDLLGPDPRLPAGVPVVGAAAYESLRIRAGVPAMDSELTEATIPAEAGQGVIDRSVSFTKGCFTGQELVARIDSRGGNVPRHLRGLVVRGDPPAPGAVVSVDGAEVGQVTSAAPHPEAGSVALAYIRRAVSPPADATVAVRTGTAPATVVDLPFAR
ncbi:MAG TPA: glycine cleavage T C-terminal barrel domain-containing protein, partial [Acidimicrobiales bacterium]|nr:glycine cleavage T C-terminal barrel domain-containing protein [Acidimicrobiales bacterium]